MIINSRDKIFIECEAISLKLITAAVETIELIRAPSTVDRNDSWWVPQFLRSLQMIYVSRPLILEIMWQWSIYCHSIRDKSQCLYFCPLFNGVEKRPKKSAIEVGNTRNNRLKKVYFFTICIKININSYIYI